MTTTQNPSPIRAPELSGAIAWLNVPAPLSLKALRGKVVLLDFWTYDCINCIHILPNLKKLEARFPDQLVVIGVHAAKFENEKAIDLAAGRVSTTAGTGEQCTWKEEGGKASTVAINSPWDIAVHGRSFSSRWLAVDPQSGRMTTLAGMGKPGHTDGPGRKAHFYEPGGLSASGEKIFVADTNNHCVRVVEAKTGATITPSP